MKTWQEAAVDAGLSGGAAAAASLAALAIAGRREGGSALGPINAPSHMLWGEEGVHQDGPSARHTVPGLLLHVGSSLFWAVFYEKYLSPPAGAAAGERLSKAGLAAAGAALVDLKLVPERLTPGFERRLSSRSLLLVYSAFALGLAAGGSLAARRRARRAPTPGPSPELLPLDPFPAPAERPTQHEVAVPS